LRMRKSSKRSSAKSNDAISVQVDWPVNILGLNSGTSADGLDAALVEFKLGQPPRVMLYHTFEYPSKIKKKILALGEPDYNDGRGWLEFDMELGRLMGEMARRIINRAARSGLEVDFLASHGQTVRHLPEGRRFPLSLQIGDPWQIAGITGKPVVANFRRSDLAAGGQGAPLSPILHERLFRHRSLWRAVVNIGGIANVTVLPPLKSRRKPLAGDCGPGNMIIDDAVNRLFNKRYDRNGEIARSGRPDRILVNRIMRRKYFSLRPPKSTGREQFGRKFVSEIISAIGRASKQDIIATLTEITIRAIVGFLDRFAGEVDEVYLCGGGANNDYIVQGLRERLPGTIITTTTSHGYHHDYVEALLWAYLGYCFVTRTPVGSSSFTGSRKKTIPGMLCLP
jgi:anhydro-N-acetylmuramic acid kinase